MGSRARGVVVALVLVVAGVPLSARAGDPAAEALLGPGAIAAGDGHYRIPLPDGTFKTTHGPDYAENHGGGFDPGDAERTLVCANDWYQHVLYARPSSASDRYATSVPTIRSSMRRMNAVLHEESMLSGDRPADYKVKCDGTGDIQVDTFTSPGNDPVTVIESAWAAGYTSGAADYTIFFDGSYSGYCGVGTLTDDDRLVESNANNAGGDYAVVYGNCWTNETAMHENGHNQGAVQASAPYSTGSGHHCYDENDVMCYSPDGGNQNQGGTIDRCTDRIHFDCGNDSYFDSDPEPGEYLATHWNIGSQLNRFITFGPLHRAPRAAFTMSCSGLACSFTDISIDDGTIVSWSWDLGDEQTASVQNPSHTYAEAGTYLVTLTATDNQGLTGSSTQTLVVPNSGDPDPGAPTLTDGVNRTDRSAPDGQWRTYKIFVPHGRQNLTASVDGQPCTLNLLCNPDVDLYLRYGQRPTTEEYACASESGTNDEACGVSSPAPGFWYVGVYTAFATPEVLPISTISYRVKADHS